ncbi:MAG TPA: hypothetical protein PLU37_08345 [Chitinophagaceae bacterium]|nr:hypothetical protein [Chitinophagaceae bacterium]
MTRIGLLSDTHGFLDERVFDYFSNCDETDRYNIKIIILKKTADKNI